MHCELRVCGDDEGRMGVRVKEEMNKRDTEDAR